MTCLGCRIAAGIEPNLNIVYETALVTCVLDIAPFNEGHVLILPKKHYLDVQELDAETAYAIMAASQKLSNVIKDTFKPDGKYHMHLIPRYEGDGFSWSEPLHPHDAEKRLSHT